MANTSTTQISGVSQHSEKQIVAEEKWAPGKHFPKTGGGTKLGSADPKTMSAGAELHLGLGFVPLSVSMPSLAPNSRGSLLMDWLLGMYPRVFSSPNNS